MSSIEVRPFRRGDRDQLTALVNTHAAAVVPGLGISVSSMLSELERQPGEFLIDPWVSERLTLVAEQRDRIGAAAHLLRYAADERVNPAYANSGVIRWLLFWPEAPAGNPYWSDATEAAEKLIAACLRQLDDWGVTSQSAEGELPTEHLLLIAGQFDKDRIYGAAEQNGAQRSAYDGETVMLIQPFTREKGEMQDLRWLLIVENRIGIFGTPFLVQQALHRYQTHADVDRLLKERLSQLPHDVSSWNVLVSTTDRKSLNMHEGSRWAGLVEEAEVLIVGARFGPKVRVDFLLHANSIHGAGFFQQKVSSFAQVFAGVLPNGSEERRLAKVSLEPDRVRGSIELSKRQFQMWCEQGSLDQGLQAARPMSPGE